MEIKLVDTTPEAMKTVPTTTLKVFRDYLVMSNPEANRGRGSLVVYKNDQLHSRFPVQTDVYSIGEFVWINSADSQGNGKDNDIVLVSTHRDRIGGNIIGLDLYKFVKKWSGDPLTGDYEIANFKEHLILLSSRSEGQGITFQSGRIGFKRFDDHDLTYHF
jgi:hypothetical protein